MMETYAYAILSLALLAIWIVLFVIRPDLRRSMLRESMVGGVAGILAELWYFRDYWQPPTLMGLAKLSPEDFVAGFAAAGMGRALYDVAFRMHDGPRGAPRNRELLLLFLAGFFSLLLFSNVFGWNSCIVSEGIFVILAAFMVWRQPDLLPVALWSALMVGAIGFVLYVLIFNGLAPEFWQRYWLLAGSPAGVTIRGIPLTEILWFATWGSLAGVAHNFRIGARKVKR